MIQYRNISPNTVDVFHGVGGTGWARVAPDALVSVDDSVASSYDCQPKVWSPVDLAAYDARLSARRAAADAAPPLSAPVTPEQVAALEAKVAADEAALAAAEGAKTVSVSASSQSTSA